MKQIVFLIALFLISSCGSCPERKEEASSFKLIEVISDGLKLEPSVENITDSSAGFVLKATRLKLPEEEYLPDSEDFRIEIFSEKGELVWNSDYKKNFLQMVGKVKPLKEGETYTYSKLWNGKRNSGAVLAPGNYKIRMTIPSKPKFYSCTILFKWKQL